LSDFLPQYLDFQRVFKCDCVLFKAIKTLSIRCLDFELILNFEMGQFIQMKASSEYTYSTKSFQMIVLNIYIIGVLHVLKLFTLPFGVFKLIYVLGTKWKDPNIFGF
jgi:hypothetical protein